MYPLKDTGWKPVLRSHHFQRPIIYVMFHWAFSVQGWGFGVFVL